VSFILFCMRTKYKQDADFVFALELLLRCFTIGFRFLIAPHKV
jgi:hypothetical protein